MPMTEKDVAEGDKEETVTEIGEGLALRLLDILLEEIKLNKPNGEATHTLYFY